MMKERSKASRELCAPLEREIDRLRLRLALALNPRVWCLTFRRDGTGAEPRDASTVKQASMKTRVVPVDALKGIFDAGANYNAAAYRYAKFGDGPCPDRLEHLSAALAALEKATGG